MRKIYSAVRFGPPQIVPVRKFGMKVSFFFSSFSLKIVKINHIVAHCAEKLCYLHIYKCATPL